MTHAPAATGIPSVNELSELALWMAAGLAGMVTAMLMARAPFFRGLLRRLDRQQPAPRANARPPKPPTPERSLPLLAEAIVGSSKTTVAAVLGPPRSAALAGRAPASNASFWQADTRYYPRRERAPAAAMALRFDEDFAHRVEFLGRPKTAR
jgi:hypothetical protein